MAMNLAGLRRGFDAAGYICDENVIRNCPASAPRFSLSVAPAPERSKKPWPNWNGCGGK